MDLFKFFQVATNKMSLQEMVDEHARMGMSDGEIIGHLRKDHSIAGDVLIPPPTRAAQRKRIKMQESGNLHVISKATTEQIDVIQDLCKQGKNEEALQLLMESPMTPGPGNQSPVTVADGLAMKDCLSQNASGEGTYQPKGAGLVQFEEMYQPTGPTVLDRLIHGFATWFKGFRPDESVGLSNFEIYRDKVGLSFRRNNYSLDFRCNSEPYDMIHCALHPWFQAGVATKNVQIGSDFAEVLLSAKAPKESAWIKEFTKTPVYVDIDEREFGYRSISGIFCTPRPETNGFDFTVIMEWIGQGYESVISSSYPFCDEDPAIIMSFANESLPPEAMKELYGDVLLQAVHILATSSMYLTSLQGSNAEIPLLTKTSRSADALSDNEKKQRNKEKTHSYFVMQRVNMPADQFGYKGVIARGRWNLDHIVSVSGHLRWQACGPNMSQHKLIWIDSFEKGSGSRVRPDENPVLQRILTTSAHELQEP